MSSDVLLCFEIFSIFSAGCNVNVLLHVQVAGSSLFSSVSRFAAVVV